MAFDFNTAIATDAATGGMLPGVGGFLGGLFGGGDRKKVYPHVVVNDDGTIKLGPNIDQDKTYRKASKLAMAFQSFLPVLTQAQNVSNAKTRDFDTQNFLDLLTKYGGDIANQNVALDRIAQLGQGETNLQVQKLAKQADPEFYKLRELIGQKGADLLGGMDPNKLTESEIANLERTNNRNNIGQGTANTGSNLAAVKNALTFDDRLQNKRNSLTNTLTAIGNIAPNLKSGFFGNNTGANGQTQAQIGGTFSGNTGQLASNLINQNASNMQQTAQIKAAQVPQWQQIAGAIPDY